MFVYRVARALDSNKIDYAIVGGYAVALHGAVRGTVDLDIVLKLTERDFVVAEAAFRALGLEPRLPVDAAGVFRFREEYIRNRNLVAWSFYNSAKPSELVDVIITQDLRKLKIKRVQSEGMTLKIVSIKDLIRMKSESGRRQDQEDIRALKRLR